MSRHLVSTLLLVLALTSVACSNSTGPAAVTLTISRPADLQGVVISNNLQEFIAPSGGRISQYDIWLAVDSSAANAGVVVSATAPVFISDRGVLRRSSSSEIVPGQVIQVWHDSSIAYGVEEAPTGAPCYRATQILRAIALP